MGHIPASSQSESNPPDVFLAGTDLSVMYYRWDGEFLCHSAVIRLTGRGHHYDRLQREEGEGARLIFGTQLHRWWELLPQTHVNSRVLITVSRSRLPSCIKDGNNRGGQQLPFSDVTSSRCPRARWKHSRGAP